jgi:hypothetical protein
LIKIIKKAIKKFRNLILIELSRALNEINKKKLITEISDVYFSDFSKNIELQLQLDALKSTAKYVAKNMIHAKSFSSKEELLDFALKKAGVNNGLYCEFGVYKGYTINYIAEKTKTTIHGFDSFEGLPEFWRDGFYEGTFSIKNEELIFSNNIIIHKGLFEQTLPDFVKLHSENISFIHIDCDLYSSTKTILNTIGKKLVKGSVIVFDEYFNYPGWQEHEYKAFYEFISTNSFSYKYIGYNKTHEQVAIIIE